MEVRLIDLKLNFYDQQIQLSVINAGGAVTVKDVPAKEFIEVFSKHLKKGNKIKMPDVGPTLSNSTQFSFLLIKLYLLVGCLR